MRVNVATVVTTNPILTRLICFYYFLKDVKSTSWTPLRFFGVGKNDKKRSMDDSFVSVSGLTSSFYFPSGRLLSLARHGLLVCVFPSGVEPST